LYLEYWAKTDNPCSAVSLRQLSYLFVFKRWEYKKAKNVKEKVTRIGLKSINTFLHQRLPDELSVLLA